MMKIRLFGALIASAALAACGGGEDAGGDTSETSGAMENGAQETAAEETSGGEDMAGGDSMADEADAAMDEASGMAEDAMGAAEEAAGDAAEAVEGAAQDAADAAEGAAQDASDAADEAMGGADAAEDGPLVIAGLTGDPDAGRRVFARCRSCHVLEEGVNRVGPSLYGIFGRETGSVEGFRYSDANANAGITWTAETMFEYLENPREYIPGTIMSFPGLRDPQDRADVIAYMKENGGLGDEG